MEIGASVIDALVRAAAELIATQYRGMLMRCWLARHVCPAPRRYLPRCVVRTGRWAMLL